MNTAIDVTRLLPAWEQFHRATGIAPIRDAAHYTAMTTLLESLLETTAGNEKHPAMALVDLLGDLIETYESDYLPLPEATASEVIGFLMQQHELKPGDLPEIGTAEQVSALLNGDQPLGQAQIRALSARFGLSPATFAATSAVN